MFAHRRIPIASFALQAVFLMLLLGLAGFTPVAAQDAPPEATPGKTPPHEQTPIPDDRPREEVTVAAVLCPDGSCDEIGDGIGGMEIIALDASSDGFYDSCVTDASGSCVLSVPSGTQFALQHDTTVVPDGYEYLQENNPFVVDGITYVGFVPGTAEPEPAWIEVRAALCADADCDEIERYLARFEISVVNADTGEVLGSCVTNDNNQFSTCSLGFPEIPRFQLQGDKKAVPDGYVRVPAPVVDDDTGGGPPLYTILYIPEDTQGHEPAVPATDVPVTSLPATGSGDGGPNRVAPGFVIIAGAALLSVATRLTIRKPGA